MSTSWHMDVITHLEALRKPCFWDFTQFSSHRHEQQSGDSSSSPFLEKSRDGRTENAKLLGVSGDQVPSRKHPGAHQELPH